MKLLSFFTLFILIIVLTKQSSSRRIELTDHGAKGFLGLCPPKECELDQKYYESKEYRLKLYKLFTSGIPQIIWDHLKEKESKWSKSNPFNVSDRCFDGFKSVWKGIEDGDEWAFKCELIFSYSYKQCHNILNSFGHFWKVTTFFYGSHTYCNW